MNLNASHRFGADGSEIDHCDPYGFEMQLRPESASVIRDLSGYQFEDETWMKKIHMRQMPVPYKTHVYSFLPLLFVNQQRYPPSDRKLLFQGLQTPFPPEILSKNTGNRRIQ